MLPHSPDQRRYTPSARDAQRGGASAGRAIRPTRQNRVGAVYFPWANCILSRPGKRRRTTESSPNAERPAVSLLILSSGTAFSLSYASSITHTQRRCCHSWRVGPRAGRAHGHARAGRAARPQMGQAHEGDADCRESVSRR